MRGPCHANHLGFAADNLTLHLLFYIIENSAKKHYLNDSKETRT